MTDLVEKISARVRTASNHDRRYERPMTWDEAEALLQEIERLRAAAGGEQGGEGLPTLTNIEAEVDDSMGEPEFTVRWRRGEDWVALICGPSGRLSRVISPGRLSEPVVATHVMALAGGERGGEQGGGEGAVAEVLWYDPRTDPNAMKPRKIIDGSLAFMDTAPIGTKLYAGGERGGEQAAKVDPVSQYYQSTKSIYE